MSRQGLIASCSGSRHSTNDLVGSDSHDVESVGKHRCLVFSADTTLLLDVVFTIFMRVHMYTYIIIAERISAKL